MYLVGGPVRDLLLDSPIKDLDFVFVGDAPALAGRLAEEAGAELVVHPRFGTATVILGEARVDLVTARREVYPQPGALPEVSEIRPWGHGGAGRLISPTCLASSTKVVTDS